MQSDADSKDFPFFLLIVAGFLMLILSASMIGIFYA